MSVLHPLTVATARPARATYSEDLVTVLAGSWLVLALFSDGWAHLNVPQLEGFFTPWHAGLYSGFLASALWIGVLALRHGVAPGAALRAPLTAWRRLPAGYPAAAVGAGVFAVGGVFDFAWHTAFGIEQGIDALLSPSHLTLLVGAALLLSAPARGAWRSPGDPPPRFWSRFPELLSLALTTGLAAFFLLYVSAFLRPGVDEAFRRVPEGAPGHEAAQLGPASTVEGYLLTTGLVVVPLLLLARRGPLPRGATTLLVGTVAWLSVALQDFANGPGALAVTVAAAVADILLVRLDRTRGVTGSARLPLIGGLVPGLLWPAQLIAVSATEGIRYPVALWTGVVVLSVLVGVVLGILADGERARTGSRGS